MRVVALTKNKVVPYVLQDNREDPSESQTTFKLRALPFAVRSQVMSVMTVEIQKDAVAEGQSWRPEAGRKWELACRFGIAGWENLTDAEGAEVAPEFEGKKLHSVQPLAYDSLSLLPDEAIIELGQEIIRLSTSDAESVGK